MKWQYEKDTVKFRCTCQISHLAEWDPRYGEFPDIALCGCVSNLFPGRLAQVGDLVVLRNGCLGVCRSSSRSRLVGFCISEQMESIDTQDIYYCMPVTVWDLLGMKRRPLRALAIPYLLLDRRHRLPGWSTMMTYSSPAACARMLKEIETLGPKRLLKGSWDE